MRFKTEVLNVEVFADFPWNWNNADGRPSFSAPSVFDQKFDSLQKLEDALKAHDLTLRKNFSNPVAFRRSYRYPVSYPAETVTVTSVGENGKEAWIKNAKGNREKVQMTSLYAFKDEVEKAIEIETTAHEQVKKWWAAVTLWTPQPKPADY
jgi:hypothetical protein